jgi:hypothetical protein
MVTMPRDLDGGAREHLVLDARWISAPGLRIILRDFIVHSLRHRCAMAMHCSRVDGGVMCDRA